MTRPNACTAQTNSTLKAHAIQVTDSERSQQKSRNTDILKSLYSQCVISPAPYSNLKQGIVSFRVDAYKRHLNDFFIHYTCLRSDVNVSMKYICS